MYSILVKFSKSFDVDNNFRKNFDLGQIFEKIFGLVKYWKSILIKIYEKRRFL